ncbi:HNH endonuclease signature motif containing protein [Nocardioides terrisoli]|uniref:HNH endonuclease signature motif containing protein n=1 Tax=Nocardioides terrisoli TaxID=3388267 RepID=UPI0037CCB215
MTELLEHLPTDGHANHGRVGATIMIHLDLAHLRDGLAGATTDTETILSAGTARRLACNAGLIPAVLGTASVPLDLGRQTRLHTKAQRAALSLTYPTCAAHGCQRPFAWTEIHHIDPWTTGGPTDLHNAIPLGWHHHRIHDNHYTHHLHPNGEITLRRRRQQPPPRIPGPSPAQVA